MKKLMKKLYEIIGKIEITISAFCFASSTLLIFLAAIARTLKHPINWSQDLSLFLFAWSVFLSADVALRADRLVNIDLLINRFPARARKNIMIVNFTIMLAFLIALFFYGIKLSLFSRQRVFQGIPGFSYSWVTLSAVIGSLLLSTTVFLKLKNLILKDRHTTKKSEA